MTTPASTQGAQLRRALGKWDLTAIGVNQVIGGAVFLVPASLALQLGSWSWLAVGLVGLLAMAIALNFAEAGSRFDGTGGPYLYTRAAFGRFVGFEVGWMSWITRVTSWAAVVNGLADALGYYWPGIRAGGPRLALISAVVIGIMALNVRGIRQSATVVNALTIGKLTPLVLFIFIGLPYVSTGALAPVNELTGAQIATAALLLIFAFGGYEIIPVPAGEALDPKKDVPFAMIMTIVIVALVMMLVQVVALGTLPDLAGSRTPLADASLLFMGAWGAMLLTAGASVSMAGNNVGAALSGSRILFALAEQGDVPRMFARIHPRFRTPDVAIVFTCLLTLALAVSGSFVALAAASAVARLLVYGGTCASVLALRRQGRAPFTIPLGPVVPVVALAVCAAIVYGATAVQIRTGGIALAVGAGLYVMGKGRRQKAEGRRERADGR
jgi:basic amino acid/polyamine antiporter, APA family